MRLVGMVVALVWPPVAVPAHRSRAEFPAYPLQFEGALVDGSWRNPHALLRYWHVDDNGEERPWRREAYGNALTLQRTGVTGELSAAGSQARVFGRVSERYDRVRSPVTVSWTMAPRRCSNTTQCPVGAKTLKGGPDQRPRTACPE